MTVQKIFPRENDYETIYLNQVITKPSIQVGDYTIYNDFEHGNERKSGHKKCPDRVD